MSDIDEKIKEMIDSGNVGGINLRVQCEPSGNDPKFALIAAMLRTKIDMAVKEFFEVDLPKFMPNGVVVKGGDSQGEDHDCENCEQREVCQTLKDNDEAWGKFQASRTPKKTDGSVH